ncbi:MAG: hypothetical protein ACI3VN_04385 [Candidatus Onthomonas sp.]
MRRAITLLALGAAALLLAAGSLLPRAVFRAQDSMAQAQPEPVTSEELSLDLANPESSYWERMAAVGGANYSATGLVEAYMNHTAEEALSLTWALLEEYRDQIPLLDGYVNMSAHSALAWGGDNITFRIWNLVYSEYDTSGFCSVILDDETGLPISIFCSYSGDGGRYGMEDQDLLTVCQSLLEPFETRLEEAGLTRASLNCYPSMGVPGSGAVFDLEYGGEEPATVLVWLGEDVDRELSWSVNVPVDWNKG